MAVISNATHLAARGAQFPSIYISAFPTKSGSKKWLWFVIDLPPPGSYRFQQSSQGLAETPMPELPPESVRELLARWNTGDQQALEALVPLVYNELHNLAHCYLRRERSDHTLQTTALIHEAYLRLVEQGPFKTEDSNHFVAIAATLMRQILVDYARRYRAAKRGADCTVKLEGELGPLRDQNFDVIALDDALTRLAERDPQQARVVELRFFAGLTVEETGALLKVSPATVKREWSMARAWLSRQIKRGEIGNKVPVAES
jgi:RNA polymerase sigma factor (TIGR02999 family)